LSTVSFWGDTLKLHQAIEGTKFGGVGPGLSPRAALAVGLTVDVDALPESIIGQLKQGKVNLDDPAVTLALLKLNSVVGVDSSIPMAASSRWEFSARFATLPSIIP
jgi:hypothetical protein